MRKVLIGLGVLVGLYMLGMNVWVFTANHPVQARPVHSYSSPRTTPAPAQPTPYPTTSPTAEPGDTDVDVSVDHEDDDHHGKSRFCRRHWYC